MAYLAGGYLVTCDRSPPLRCSSSLAIELSKLLARDLARAEFRRRVALDRTAEGHDGDGNVQRNKVEES